MNDLAIHQGGFCAINLERPLFFGASPKRGTVDPPVSAPKSGTPINRKRIDNLQHSMISSCCPFWRKHSVSIKLHKCSFLAVEKTPFWRMHENISERTVLYSRQHDNKALMRFSHEALIKVPLWVRQAARTFRQSPPQGDFRDRG